MSFDALADLWTRTHRTWSWHCPFVLPFWLETVCRHLGATGDPHITAVWLDGEPIGCMPLSVDGTTARFLGSHDVCDYQDLIAAPGRHRQVLEAILAHLVHEGVRRLDWRTLRPDGAVLAAFASILPAISDRLVPDEANYEMPLPGDWEGYLGRLNGKQRHELRRKLRRLDASAPSGYRFGGTVPHQAAADTFVALFRRNRPDKAAFMSPAMEDCFRDLLRRLADRRMLRLGFLEIDRRPAAGVFCFDYRGIRYLYNSGYDKRFESLSVGVLSKAFSIRDAIEAGCRRYDFLKGAEVYKKRLGGEETPLFRCRMDI